MANMPLSMFLWNSANAPDAGPASVTTSTARRHRGL